MECHRQLFLPHQRTCYKDSPTWVKIMPPIPAPKHTLSCAIVQRGHSGGGGSGLGGIVKKTCKTQQRRPFFFLFNEFILPSWLDQQQKGVIYTVIVFKQQSLQNQLLSVIPHSQKANMRMWLQNPKCAQQFYLHILAALMLCSPPLSGTAAAS